MASSIVFAILVSSMITDSVCQLPNIFPSSFMNMLDQRMWTTGIPTAFIPATPMRYLPSSGAAAVSPNFNSQQRMNYQNYPYQGVPMAPISPIVTPSTGPMVNTGNGQLSTSGGNTQMVSIDGPQQSNVQYVVTGMTASGPEYTMVSTAPGANPNFISMFPQVPGRRQFQTASNRPEFNSFAISNKPGMNSFSIGNQNGINAFNPEFQKGMNSFGNTNQVGINSFAVNRQPGMNSFTTGNQNGINAFSPEFQNGMNSFDSTNQGGLNSFAINSNQQPGINMPSSNIPVVNGVPNVNAFVGRTRQGLDTVFTGLKQGLNTMVNGLQNGIRDGIQQGINSVMVPSLSGSSNNAPTFGVPSSQSSCQQT